MLKLCFWLERNFTAIKVFSVLLIILAVLDNLATPVAHSHLEKPAVLWEYVLRGWFLFVGIFGVLGNGKTFKVRAFLVGTPFIYLGVFYITRYLESHILATIIPSALSLFIGLWLLSLGVVYEFKQRNCIGNSDIINNVTSKLGN